MSDLQAAPGLNVRGTPAPLPLGSIGNYKGVMLCNRPNENVLPEKPRRWCSRVDPKERLGVAPILKARPKPKKQRTHLHITHSKGDPAKAQEVAAGVSRRHPAVKEGGRRVTVARGREDLEGNIDHSIEHRLRRKQSVTVPRPLHGKTR